MKLFAAFIWFYLRILSGGKGMEMGFEDPPPCFIVEWTA